jgi:hypothetical protein
MGCLPGGSRSRFPPYRRRKAEPPAATIGPGLGMREFPHHPWQHQGSLCLSLRYALLLSVMRCPQWNDLRVISNDDGILRPRMPPHTALIYVQMGQTTSETISPPTPQSLPTFSLRQRRCRPPLRFGPSGDFRSERRRVRWHRDGEHQEFRPAGGFAPLRRDRTGNR